MFLFNLLMCYLNKLSNLTQAVKKILLAADDLDDNVVFMDVVNEIDNQINVSIVNDGEELIRTIVENAPNILFLDVFYHLKMVGLVYGRSAQCRN